MLHSPAPWRLAGDEIMAGRRHVALVYGIEQHVPDDPEAVANAHLIREAPELLACLKAARSILVQFVDFQNGEWAARFDAAIARAEAAP